MEKRFCTEGPVRADDHYLIAPLSRVDLPGILTLIEERKYFILHAPRQTGKTSSLLALEQYLNEIGSYRAVYLNVESSQAARDNYTDGIKFALERLGKRVTKTLGDDFLEQSWKAMFAGAGAEAFRSLLDEWCRRDPKRPVCLFIDEIDSLVGDTLLYVLRTLRAGYPDRPTAFPQSVILCGVRDIRDYRIHGTKEIIAGGSAFKIKAESLRIGDFTPANIRDLYGQHTTATGQQFDEAVFRLVWDLTQGQPWLVNALASKACFEFERDRTKPITCDLILRAKEDLILKRVTHLDQLADKLREPRVRRVIEPMLQGEDTFADIQDNDDLQYVIDLGLVRRDPETGLQISNAIYREVIPREITYLTQIELESTQRSAWYISADGRLNMNKLLAAFQQFFRENSEIWLERYQYKEAGPQLLLQAFLQRIINGGGRIDREFALGRRRTDLLLHFGSQRVVIELKIVRGTLEKTITEGIAQTGEYMDRCGSDDAHLIVFNRDPKVRWDDRIFERQSLTSRQRPLTIWGM